MLSKYSIKEGEQVISKANSVLKGSGWCTQTLIPEPSIQNKTQFLKEPLSFQQSCVKFSPLPQTQCFPCGQVTSVVACPISNPQDGGIKSLTLRCLLRHYSSESQPVCTYRFVYNKVLAAVTALQELPRG